MTSLMLEALFVTVSVFTRNSFCHQVDCKGEYGFWSLRSNSESHLRFRDRSALIQESRLKLN